MFNSVGQRTSPCGMPLDTHTLCDDSSCSITFCNLSVSQFFNYLTCAMSIFYQSSFFKQNVTWYQVKSLTDVKVYYLH